MSQVIKFRAWDKLGSDGMIKDVQFRREEQTFDQYLNTDTGRFVLMQFTDIKDNKRTEEFPDGQEMFKDDIITCPCRFDGSRKLSFNKLGTVCTVDSDGSQHSIDMLMLNEIEIIGNIHENPELLKGESQ